MSKEIERLKRKYQITGWFYDILDYPWERLYSQWRPWLLTDVAGRALEAGVGTGRNLAYYSEQVELTGVDLSPAMLHFARKRARKVRCRVNLLQADATDLDQFPAQSFDWYISTFMFCVLPDSLQPQAIAEMVRVLRPGGRFCLIEILYSKISVIRRRQSFLAPLVEKLYGARFDRHTLEYLDAHPALAITSTHFLKDDTYLLIKGQRIE